jgi:hypothetical protein
MKNIIIVFTDNTPYGKTALAHAQKLSQIFDAEISAISLQEKSDLRSIFATTEIGNILCMVMPVVPSKKLGFFHVKNARKWICKSRVPVITIGNKKPENDDYQQIILPLDINCKEKELALWASNFPAYFQKNCPQIPIENILIHIIFNQYKDELMHKKVQHNIDFVTKMFNNLEVSYQLHPLTKVNNLYTFGLQFAKKQRNSVLLFLMTEHYSLIDLIFGPVENRILGNMEEVPVLCLNGRGDLVALCR